MNERQARIDFVARLADAWDGKGDNVFLPSGVEHRALLELAGLPLVRASGHQMLVLRWTELTQDDRIRLVFAARRAIELGRQCAWVFGEGQGARF